MISGRGMDRRGRRTAFSLLVALLILPALLLVRTGVLKSRHRRTSGRTTRERVDYVIDGDTLILEGGERVRLLGIDAPEMREGKAGAVGPFPQPGALEATEALRNMVQGCRVKVVRRGHDHFDRTLAKIYLPDGRDAGGLLVKQGLARKYLR